MLAARPSGFADGTNSTTVELSKASSEPNARSRSRIKQASRPAGSLPCWLHTWSWVGFVRASAAVAGAGLPSRTRCSGRPFSVWPMTSIDIRADSASTAGQERELLLVCRPGGSVRGLEAGHGRIRRVDRDRHDTHHGDAGGEQGSTRRPQDL